MSEDFTRSRHLQHRPTCESCGDPLPSGSQEDEYGRLLCLECQANAAEAAYERQQAADLESPPESSREEQPRTWEEHQRLHWR